MVTGLEQVFRDEWGRVLATLIRTARNRAVDRIRREQTLAVKLGQLMPELVEEEAMDATAFPDERLPGRRR